MTTSEKLFAWLHPVVDPKRPVIFVDTDNLKETSDTSHPGTHEEEDFIALEGKLGGSIVNRTEAKLVWLIVNALKVCGHNAAS